MSNTTLGKIASIITGPFGSQLHMEDYVETGIPVIMPQNIYDRRIDETGIARITQEDYVRLKRYATQRNDIVFARRGDVEKHAFIESDSPALCGTGCLRVRVQSRDVYPAFLSLYLNKPETRKWLSTHAVGTNMPNLNTDILSSVPVSLPSYDEQIRQARLFQSINDKIYYNMKVNDNLHAQLRLMYDYWFTQFDFPDEHGKPYRASGGQMIWNEQLKRNIPSDWQSVRLSEYIYIETQSVNPQNDLNKVYEHYSIPAYDSKRYPVFENASSIASNKYKVFEDCVLVSKLNPQFPRVWMPLCLTDNAICSTEFMVYRAFQKQNRAFLYMLVQSTGFVGYMISNSASSTGSRKRVSPDTSVSYYFAAPKDDELILLFADIAQPLIDQSKRLYEENQDLISLRDWLLPLLMNGQATVSD